MPLQQQYADRAVRSEPVGQGDHQYLVPVVGDQVAQHRVRVVHPGGVHLAGAQGQFLDPGELVAGGPADAHPQVQGAQELLVGSRRRSALGLAAEARLVHLPTPPGVDGAGRGRELRQLRQREDLFGRVAPHLGQMEGHLGALGGPVVDERDGRERETEPVRDPPHRLGLGAPPDLREYEVLGEAEGLQPGPGVLVVVAARDGMQDAAESSSITALRTSSGSPTSPSSSRVPCQSVSSRSQTRHLTVTGAMSSSVGSSAGGPFTVPPDGRGRAEPASDGTARCCPR